MGEHDINPNNSLNEVTILECRTCLHIMSPNAVLFNIFQKWNPPWDGMENTIAEDLEKLSNVKVKQSDKHSKVICRNCYELLHSACAFTTVVKQSDQILRQRYPLEQEMDMNVWPKPIQIDKSFNNQENSIMNVDIKQEALSDDEYDDAGSIYESGDVYAKLDIKVEPEEMIQQQPSEQFTVNETTMRSTSSSSTDDVTTNLLSNANVKESYEEQYMKYETCSIDDNDHTLLQTISFLSENMESQPVQTTCKGAMNVHTKAKILRNSGKQYISPRNKLVSERKLKPPCGKNCRLKCSEKITLSERQTIFQNYWDMGSSTVQWNFIKNSMSIVQPKYQYKKKDSHRQPNNAYYLSVNDKKLRVCKKFFTNTLGISGTPIYTVKEKVRGFGDVGIDKRGKHGNQIRKASKSSASKSVKKRLHK